MTQRDTTFLQILAVGILDLDPVVVEILVVVETRLLLKRSVSCCMLMVLVNLRGAPGAPPKPGGGAHPALTKPMSEIQIELNKTDLRGAPGGPPGGPPLPPKPGGAPPGNPPGGNAPKPPGGGGPPTPAAGPPNPTGSPLPAGLLTPGPACIVAGAAPPGALVPNLADGSDGGGPSTEQDTMFVPRSIIRPNVLFSSASTNGAAVAPGALTFAAFLLTRRNSSVSARTIFICWSRSASSLGSLGNMLTLSNASICPVICLPSFKVILMR